MISRRLIFAVLIALTVASACVARSQGTTTSSSSVESGNPIADQGSSYHFRSQITAVTPTVSGLGLQVLEFADRLLLTNHSGKAVTVLGYQGEPYARVLPDGTVQLNTRSPAYYLNQNFYGNVTVPASASASAAPHWMTIDRTAQLEWHDHRIHWMSPVLPPQVKDRSKQTKIFDWQVPIEVGAQKGTVNGVLYWTPESGTKTPTVAFIALLVIVVAGLAFVLFVRRRRARYASAVRRAADSTDAPIPPDSSPPPEAW